MFKQLFIIINWFLLFAASDFYASQSAQPGYNFQVYDENGKLIHQEQWNSFKKVANLKEFDDEKHCGDSLFAPMILCSCGCCCFCSCQVCPYITMTGTGMMGVVVAAGEYCTYLKKMK